MVTDHSDPYDEDTEEFGVLAASASSDTAALGVLGGATAQVTVSLPADDEDDLDDDDVVGDEVAEPRAYTGELDTVEAEVVEDGDDHEQPTEPDQAGRSDDDGAPPSEVDADTVSAQSDEEAVALPAPATIDGERADPSPEAGRDAHDGDITPDDDSVAEAATPDVAVEAIPLPALAPAPSAPALRRSERPHDLEHPHTARVPDLSLTSRRLTDLTAGEETADLLTEERLVGSGHGSTAEPEGAWRHLLYSVSRGRINLGDSKRARAQKDLTARIAAPLPGSARFVPVLSRKGGVGKTTVTTLLGMALADARDDRVIAIDANPDRGTLADRIARPVGRTVRDLVQMKTEIGGYSDMSAIVARDHTRLDVLASDADPGISEAFDDHGYEEVAALAEHFYSIVLTDTGTGIVHSVMAATLRIADQLVIVTGLSVDEARLASETLTWLEANGPAAAVRGAVVVLNSTRTGTPLVRESELEAHFATRVRAVVRIPYDPLIATGGAIVFRELQPATRDAARALAAAVIEGLRATRTAA